MMPALSSEERAFSSAIFASETLFVGELSIRSVIENISPEFLLISFIDHQGLQSLKNSFSCPEVRVLLIHRLSIPRGAGI